MSVVDHMLAALTEQGRQVGRGPEPEVQGTLRGIAPLGLNTCKDPALQKHVGGWGESLVRVAPQHELSNPEVLACGEVFPETAVPVAGNDDVVWSAIDGLTDVVAPWPRMLVSSRVLM